MNIAGQGRLRDKRMLPPFRALRLFTMTESIPIDYLNLLVEHGNILGEFDPSKVSNLPPRWFWDRRVDLIYFRGDLQIRSSENITFGFRVKILTASHSFQGGGIGRMVLKRTWIDRGVFVGSCALLYNCYLQEHSIVSVGSVVRNMTVPPYTVVEGNPAVIVAKYDDGKWRAVKPENNV